MSEEGGGKIRNKKVSNPPKPYERRKSFLGKVTDTVKELISPSWLSDLVNSVKKPNSQQEDEQPIPPAQEPQYMSSLQSHQQRNRIQSRDSSQGSPPKFVPLTRNGLANLSPRSSLPLVPSMPPQQPQQRSQPPSTFCTQRSDIGDVSRKSQVQPNTFLQDSKSVDGNRNFLTNCTAGRGRLDSDGSAGTSDATARPGPSNTEANPADTSSACNHNESIESDEQEDALPASVNRLNKSTTWTEGFTARKPRSASRNKPGFDISLFGAPLHSNSLLGDSSHESSFYPGKTMYGGASAQRKTKLNVTGPYQTSFPVRQKMKVKPLNTSRSAATSSTAQKILETLEKMSTPLSEAKKIPTDDTVMRLNSSFNPTSYKPARHSIGSYLNTRRELQKSQSGPPTGKVSTPVPVSISRNYQRVTVPQTQPGTSFLSEKGPLSTSQQTPQEPEKTSSTTSGGGKLKSKKFQQHFPGRKSAEDDDEEVEIPNLRTDFTLPVIGTPQFAFGTSQPTKPVEKTTEKPNAEFKFSTPIQKTPTKQSDQVPPTKTDFTFSSPLSMESESGVKPKSVTFDIEPVKDKEPSAAFSPPAFKFGSPLGLQTKSPSNLGASPVLPRSSGGLAPATELKTGSVMDVLGKSDEKGFGYNTGSSTSKNIKETTSMGGFKPASELKQGSVMDVLGGGSSKTSSSFGGSFEPAKELKKGSVMDVLGKSSQEDNKPSLSEMFKVPEGSWECDTCCINNKSDVTKCAACGAKKPGGSGSASAPSSQPSLSSLFKVAEGSWTCDTCMIQNKSEDTKCAACQTKKPGAVVSPPSSQPSLSSMFKVAEGSWTCDTCMIQNKSEDTKCAACQTKKPGAADAVNSPVKESLAAKFKKPTGDWDCDTCLVPNGAAATKCIACETPRPGLQPSSSSGLKFGGVPVNNLTSSVGKGGFIFGNASKDSSTDNKSVSSSGAGQISFGIPVVSSSNSTLEPSKSSIDVTGGFKFGTGEISVGGSSGGGFKFGTASSAPSVAPTTGFKIGSLSAPKSDTVTGGFQMPSVKSSPVGDLSQNKTESSSTFKSLFGVDKSEITSGPKTDSTSGKVSNGSLSMPVASSTAAGFQFGAPTKAATFSAGPDFTMAKSSEETPKPSPLFNVQSSASTAPAPSLKRSHNEENGPSDAKRTPFMFNSGTTAEPAKSLGNNIVFGSPASAPALEAKPLIFQAPTAPTSTLPTAVSTAPTGGFSFGMGGNSTPSGGLATTSFGATAKNPSGFNFAVETNKSAVFNFGAGSGTAAATTAPVFGSSTNTDAKTTAPSMPFTFTAQPSTQASQGVPTPFGSAQETTPAFAANTSGFGSGGNVFGSTNSTPSFGASGAVPPSGFGAAGTGFNTTSAGNTPAFGAATTTTNAAPTGGFNFGNPQQSFNFGAQSSAPVNNGVFQFGAKPGEGNSAAAPQANAGFNFNASSSFNFGQSAQPAMPGGTASFNIGSSNDASSGRKIKKAVRKIRR